MSDLKYRRIWLCLGIGWVTLIVYLSVADLTLPQVPGFDFSDKLNHFLAYGFLMGWFGQLVKSWRSRWVFMAGLCVLGIAMEFVQGALPHRWFDVVDAAANTGGIVLAAVLLYAGADNILGWFEKTVILNKWRQ